MEPWPMKVWPGIYHAGIEVYGEAPGGQTSGANGRANQRPKGYDYEVFFSVDFSKKEAN